MSFQGDVRGIGLAELLQGLARGRKEGVLTLTARGSARCTLGLAGGKLHLLPAPDEDPEAWRQRARNAWASQPEFHIDEGRVSVIARAQRTENLYALLDGEGVHFRFNPGKLPSAEETIEGSEAAPVYCEGTAVETLLLEYARIADEIGRSMGAESIAQDSIPCVLDTTLAGGNAHLLGQIDGNSTLIELSDRLGWPIRQTQLQVCYELQRGTLRLALAEEVLSLALYELGQNNFARAARRLEAWSQSSPPGPLSTQDGQALASEWTANRLPLSLRLMPSKSVRRLMRRLDAVLGDPSAAAAHWEEVAKKDRRDLISRLHWLACQFRASTEDVRPDAREFLELARELKESGNEMRAEPALVMAAHCQPRSLAAQLDVGLGLVSVRRASEASPWILGAASELLRRDAADRALQPLRVLIEADPNNREARRLWTLARRSSTRVRKLRRHLLLAASVTAILGLGAFVKVRVDRRQQEKVDTVLESIDNPIVAMQLLESNFPDSDSAQVSELRDLILARQREQEMARRADWNDLFRDAQNECTKGDPFLALQKIIDLPDPPRLVLVQDAFPERSSLFGAIVEHMLSELDALGMPIEGSIEQTRVEDEFEDQARALEKVAAEMKQVDEVKQFRLRLTEVTDRVAERRNTREERMRAQVDLEISTTQNRLLVEAERHAAAGDFQRSLARYEDLLETDPDGRIARVLAEPIEQVRAMDNAVNEARRLASDGRHEAAAAMMREHLPNPERFFLPWRVESFPAGAQVQMVDGPLYRTPFEIESTLGERSVMRFSIEGHDEFELTLDGPRDVFVWLSRTPERNWQTEGRVDALPVAIEDDHILVDRRGKVVRVGAGGDVVWSSTIGSLSGVARSPVPMPSRPGHLLMATEDGQAWILDQDKGSLEGPWDLKSRPTAGPYPVQDTISVRLANGDLATFHTRLKPNIESAAQSADRVSYDERYRHGVDAGMSVARRGSDLSDRLSSPWTEWVCQVGEEVFRVFETSDPGGGFAVHRQGEWVYLAWEAPHADLPGGRLWLSDGAGLRAIVP